MNAHYALAAIFGLGLRGIEKKLKLPYGPLGDGATRDTVKALPTTLEAAVNSFKREGSVARELFGDYFVDHFAGTREHEIAVFQKAVTNWERKLHLLPGGCRLIMQWRGISSLYSARRASCMDLCKPCRRGRIMQPRVTDDI